jgi:hypothetical protein
MSCDMCFLCRETEHHAAHKQGLTRQNDQDQEVQPLAQRSHTLGGWLRRLAAETIFSCGPSDEVFVPATGAPRPSPATWKQRGCWPRMPAEPICLRSLAPISTASLRISSLATGPTTAAVRFRSLQQFYRWAVEDQLLPTSPMTGLRPPSIPDAPVPILDERSIKALLAAMNGRVSTIAVTLPSSACSWTRACVCPRRRVCPLRTSILIWMLLSSSARAVGRVRVPLALDPPGNRALPQRASKGTTSPRVRSSGLVAAAL